MFDLSLVKNNGFFRHFTNILSALNSKGLRRQILDDNICSYLTILSYNFNCKIYIMSFLPATHTWDILKHICACTGMRVKRVCVICLATRNAINAFSEV